MPGPAKTREQVEAELYAKVLAARAEYDARIRESRALDGVVAATLGNADGTLAINQSRRHIEAANQAIERYRVALKVFTDFVINGKYPADSPDD